MKPSTPGGSGPRTPSGSPTRLSEPIRFGDVWLIKRPGRFLGRVEVDHEPYLVVSSDFYNLQPLPRILGVQVVHREVRLSDVGEPVPGYGTALLDRSEWLKREWFEDRPVSSPRIPAHRHHDVRRLVSELMEGRPYGF